MTTTRFAPITAEADNMLIEFKLHSEATSEGCERASAGSGFGTSFAVFQLALRWPSRLISRASNTPFIGGKAQQMFLGGSDMLHVTRHLSALALAVPLLLAGAASAQDTPSGTIQFSSTKIGVGIGVQWGGGTLTLADGSTHEFKVNGLSLADLGVSSVEATGEVYNLKDVKEFAGSYTAPQAGGALIKGAGWTQMKNGYGVVITVKAAKEGVQLTLGPGGVDITMAN